jgi:hypothetical protein
LIRRKFIGRLVKLGSLAGMAGLVTGRLTDPGIIPSVRADTGQPLIIGEYNTGDSRTTLEADVHDIFPATGPALLVLNLATEIPTGSQGTAVEGTALATSGVAYGVGGFTFSPDGQAVTGHSLSTTGGIGVSGFSDSPEAVGVLGRATLPSGANFGVMGQSDSPDGVGVRGYAAAESGVNRGVVGKCNSPDGVGVAGNNTAGGLDMVLWGSGIAGYAARTADPPARDMWQLYVINVKKDKFELRILGPSGHVNKICDLKT